MEHYEHITTGSWRAHVVLEKGQTTKQLEEEVAKLKKEVANLQACISHMKDAPGGEHMIAAYEDFQKLSGR